MVRRLPVYILADCSGSMAGEHIESVKVGIRALHDNLLDDPNALECAYLSVITFASIAEQTVPLTQISDFEPPTLQAEGTTALGGALTLLVQCVEEEVRQGAPGVKGDWKPLVFLFTDGAPTDYWQPAAEQWRARRLGDIVALACGPQADANVLKQITDQVMQMSDMSPTAFSQYFKWVSASVTQTSRKIGRAEYDEGVPLPPPPRHITIVA